MARIASVPAPHTTSPTRSAMPIAPRAAAFGLRTFTDTVAAYDWVRHWGLPAFLEVACARDCSHIIGMGDFR